MNNVVDAVVAVENLVFMSQMSVGKFGSNFGNGKRIFVPIRRIARLEPQRS